MTNQPASNGTRDSNKRLTKKSKIVPLLSTVATKDKNRVDRTAPDKTLSNELLNQAC